MERVRALYNESVSLLSNLEDLQYTRLAPRVYPIIKRAKARRDRRLESLLQAKERNAKALHLYLQACWLEDKVSSRYLHSAQTYAKHPTLLTRVGKRTSRRYSAYYATL